MIANPEWFKPGGKKGGKLCGYIHPDYVGKVLVGIGIEVLDLSKDDYRTFVNGAFFRVYEHGEMVVDIPLKTIMGFPGGFRLGRPLVLTGHSKVSVEIDKDTMPEPPQNVLLIPTFEEE